MQKITKHFAQAQTAGEITTFITLGYKLRMTIAATIVTLKEASQADNFSIFITDWFSMQNAPLYLLPNFFSLELQQWVNPTDDLLQLFLPLPLPTIPAERFNQSNRIQKLLSREDTRIKFPFIAIPEIQSRMKIYQQINTPLDNELILWNDPLTVQTVILPQVYSSILQAATMLHSPVPQKPTLPLVTRVFCPLCGKVSVGRSMFHHLGRTCWYRLQQFTQLTDLELAAKTTEEIHELIIACNQYETRITYSSMQAMEEEIVPLPILDLLNLLRKKGFTSTQIIHAMGGDKGLYPQLSPAWKMHILHRRRFFNQTMFTGVELENRIRELNEKFESTSHKT
jgi:hypothetical protein